MLRSFIAIELPDEVKKALEELQGSLKKHGADIRWARPENIHLTLKFLGDIREDDIDKISDELGNACNNLNIFKMKVAGTGIFPEGRSPRILWAGIEGGGAIINLQKDIEERMARIGFKPEKRDFRPHLTIGRFKSKKKMDALMDEMNSKKDISFGSFEVRAVSLMKSELKPSGAEYTKISDSLLKVS